MTDDKDRSQAHDTDPLADTQTSEDSPAESSGGAARISTAARRSVRAGDTLGRYELIEDVGEGGMATVYRARDKELRREVAVKVMFPHLAKREEVVRRFHREARAAAGLEHANILRVYDVGGGETDDPPFIVMELIRGHSLLGEIERTGPMLAEVAACIGALLADALAVAHKAGIIHRDIKPANVMIAPGGRVLLADFGVARLETEDSLVTKTGALLGTPAYMSPEQAGGDTATAKSDIYSLGATLYQMATGSLPYSGSPAKVMAQIAQGQLMPAVRRRAAVGPDLSRVIDRMMATEPDARPASAAAVADELRKIASASGFGDPVDELAEYFADPNKFTQAKLPTVVSALVTTAERAIADEKLPRAMALADRASALAPEDPAVTQLIEKVTEGGRATQRRKILSIAGIGVVLAGAATFGVMQIFGDKPRAAVATQHDAAAIAADATEVALAPADAELAIDAGSIAVALDAGVTPKPRDAGVVPLRRADAGVASVAVDASRAVAPDAAVPAVTPDAAVAVVAQSGYVIVKSDAWCDVTIDDVPTGKRAGPKPFAVEPGRHTVMCEQKATRKAWTRHVVVAAGATVTVEGSLLGIVEIKFDVEATLDGVPYRPGQTARLKAGSVPLVVGATKIHLQIREPCTVRKVPEVGCFRDP